MKCKNCGAELLPKDKFCGNCGAPAASRRGESRPKLLLFVLTVLALSTVMAVGGILAVGLGALRSGDLPSLRGDDQSTVPEPQVSLASFQAAVKECRPMAGVGEIHEGVDMDVLVRVEGRVGSDCRIYQEIIRDGTGRGMTGKRMTCLIPLEVLISGRAPDGPLEDYCEGSLVDTVGRQTREEQ